MFLEELLNDSVPPKISRELNQPQWMVTTGRHINPKHHYFTLNSKIMDLVLPQKIESSKVMWNKNK